ncbi:MAG: flagellar biosynthesis protein FliQ [Candidatus Caenarcaniphilales bacterium]|nr:flagellar biosynthesis protein FliQ [Candidatus Caenarcaniphilales bacterium]
MKDTLILELTNKTLITSAMISIPILIPGLVTGIIVSIFQTITSIQEQTLTFVPKFVVLIVTYLLVGGWITQYVVSFAREMFSRIPEIAS